MVVFANYEASFELLTKDLQEILEFIEPVDANAGTFSHRIYSLLLRVCTDFESLAKDLLKDGGCRKSPKKMTVRDYSTLDGTFHLGPAEVVFLLWCPEPWCVSPFRGWSTAEPPLQWYHDYNTVKHNRNAEFARACLGTLVDAMAGQFALLAKASWPNSSWASYSTLGGRLSYEWESFVVRWPK